VHFYTSLAGWLAVKTWNLRLHHRMLNGVARMEFELPYRPRRRKLDGTQRLLVEVLDLGVRSPFVFPDKTKGGECSLKAILNAARLSDQCRSVNCL